MGKHKTVSEETIEHLVEDVGLEYLLETNDIEPQVVVELLIREGLIDLEEFSWETEDDDE